MKYDIEIEYFNSAGIKYEAKELGITHMRFLGDNGEGGDKNISFYALPMKDGGEIRVANTNGDPVWEENDYEIFLELMEYAGINL